MLQVFAAMLQVYRVHEVHQRFMIINTENMKWSSSKCLESPTILYISNRREHWVTKSIIQLTWPIRVLRHLTDAGAFLCQSIW